MKKFIVTLTAILLICSCASTLREEPFTVDLNSPRHAVGSAEAYFRRYMGIGSLKHGDIDIYYYPIEDAVCLNFKVQYVNCHQFWDKTGRDAFVAAFDRYKEEYERRQLIVKQNRKTREIYGTVPGYLAWKRTPVAKQAYGSARIKLGYQFKGRSAFFTATQMEAYFEDPISQQRDQTSAVTVLFFTRSQAEALVTLFNQDYPRGLDKPTPGDGGMDEY